MRVDEVTAEILQRKPSRQVSCSIEIDSRSGTMDVKSCIRSVVVYSEDEARNLKF